MALKAAYNKIITEWEGFYRTALGIEVDLSAVNIPEKQEGFDRLLIIDRCVTPQRTFKSCMAHFSCDSWTDKDLDGLVSSDRTPQNGVYAVWVRDRIEADEELKNVFAYGLMCSQIPF